MTMATQGNCRAATGGEGKDVKNAFCINNHITIFQKDLRFELLGRLSKLRSGSGMESQLLIDVYGFFNPLPCTGTDILHSVIHQAPYSRSSRVTSAGFIKMNPAEACFAEKRGFRLDHGGVAHQGLADESFSSMKSSTISSPTGEV